MKAVDSFFFISSLTLSLFHFLEYHGSFGSCFHYGDSFRMEQSVGGVHIPGDSHAYSAHQHNGFHMSAVNAGSGGMERLFWALPKIITQMFFVFFIKITLWFLSRQLQDSVWPRSCKEIQDVSSRQAQRRVFSSRWAASTVAWATCRPSTQRHERTLEQALLHHSRSSTLQPRPLRAASHTRFSDEFKTKTKTHKNVFKLQVKPLTFT